MHGSRRSSRLVLVAALGGVVAALVAPAAVLAHPLGNFTINVYAGLRVSPATITVDAVLDRAEIPTFQERLRIDTDGDGEVSPDEADAAREAECRDLESGLQLTVDGAVADLDLTAAGVSFPPGAAGLSTMRVVCEFSAAIHAPPTTIGFEDRVEMNRLGWREIVVQGDGVTIAPVSGNIRTATASERLSAYPKSLLATPLRETSVEFAATSGGPALPPAAIRDAIPLAGTAAPPPSPAGAASPAATRVAAVPGGVASEIPDVFRTTDLTPAVVLAAIVTAAALGALHAFTPGHGKTVMAAYVLGTRGSTIHAAALGLAVTVSHTLGILVLAVVIAAAQSSLPPDVVIRALPVGAAAAIVGIGTWMIVTELRRLRDERRHGHSHVVDSAAIARDSRRAVTWRGLFALGFAGGIVPSTSALLILLATVAAGRPAFGVILVVAFGLGMAGVLFAVGAAVVRARSLFDRASAGGAFARAARGLPLVAGAVVLGLGAWLAYQAITGAPVL